MIAAARLWKRAPLWRFGLVAAVAATVLALLYPIDFPAAASREALISARFVAGPSPVLGPPYDEVAPVLGRSIPLPPGIWHMITMFNTKRAGLPFFSKMMLARLDGDRLTGLVVVQGTMTPVRNITGQYRCITPGDWDGWIIPSAGNVRQECWNFLPRLPSSAWSAPAQPIYLNGLPRLQEGGVKLPPVMMGANWFQRDRANVTLVDYFFVPKPIFAPAAWVNADFVDPAMAEYFTGIKAWAKAWTPLLEGGMTGQLDARDVETVSAHHSE